MDDWSQAALAGANALSNVAAVALGSQEDEDAQRRNYKYSMEMAKWQNETNIANWNMQNEYNSPLAQMQRLQAAGLNPNLVYGNGVTGNSSSQAPSASVPQSNFFHNPYSQFPAAIQGMMDAALKAAQVDKIQQETPNLAESQRLTQFDQRLRELQAIGQEYTNSKTKEEANRWSELWDHKLMLMFSNAELNDARRFDLDSQRNFRDGVQTDLGRSSIARNVSEMGLNEYRKQLITAQAADALASVGVKQATIPKIIQEVNNLKWDSQIKKSTLTQKEIDNEINGILAKYGVNLKNSSEIGTALSLLWSLPNLGYDAGQWVKSWFE